MKDLLDDILDLILPGRMSALCVLLTTQPANSRGFLQSAHKDLGTGYAISLENSSEKVVSFLKKKENSTLLLGLPIFGKFKCISAKEKVNMIIQERQRNEMKFLDWNQSFQVSVFIIFICCFKLNVCGKIACIFLNQDCVVLKILYSTLVETEHKNCRNSLSAAVAIIVSVVL